MSNRLVKYLLSQKVVGQEDMVVANEATLSSIDSTTLQGACTDWSSNIYATDSVQNIIVKIREDGRASLFAGQHGVAGMANGKYTNATFDTPMGIACDRSGYLYVADVGNNQIRKIDPNGNVSLLAGSAIGDSGLDNGKNHDAKFNAPEGVGVDYSGNVYVADTGNNKIRLIRGANTVDIAGDADGNPGDAIGQGSVAKFDTPKGVACDRSGQIFVTDSGNKKIKIIDTDCTVYRVLGPTFKTGDDFNTLGFIQIDGSGFIYVVDNNDPADKHRVIKLDQNGQGDVARDFVDCYHMGLAISPNQTMFVVKSDDPFMSSSSSSSESSSSESSQSSESSPSSESSQSSESSPSSESSDSTPGL
jgi:sugar lactone lactonase YvrE